MTERIDAVVIGAGPAGLHVSHSLQERGVEHVVLERGRVGNTWATQRWDSFRMNTPTWATAMRGQGAAGDPDGFMSAPEFTGLLRTFVEDHRLPVHEHTGVRDVRRGDDGFVVRTGTGRTWTARAVVVATGSQNVPRIPAAAAEITDVEHLHAAEYRRPDQLAPGAVVVVGGGQTGGQLAQELADAGRRTFLCSSAVGSVPRRYRGRDIAAWMADTGVVHTPVASMEDPRAKYQAQALLSGVAGGASMTLHSLARAGVTVLGRLEGVEGRTLLIGDDAARNAAGGIRAMAELRAKVDGFIAATGIDAPPAEADDAMTAAEELDASADIRSLDLDTEGVSAVVWATGFGGDFSYLDLGLDLDEAGVPRHIDGASTVDGLFFCGFSWLRMQSSGLVYGTRVDSEVVADGLVSRLSASRVQPSVTIR